ncbi:MAG: hypothetical protein DDT27_01033 [Dehalococcoidia bacterium]|nr:hypothetical protein [Chloroflexota bacterium]
MLTMAQIQYIKYLRDKKDKSIMEIAETVDLNWRTANQSLPSSLRKTPFPRSLTRIPSIL